MTFSPMSVRGTSTASATAQKGLGLLGRHSASYTSRPCPVILCVLNPIRCAMRSQFKDVTDDRQTTDISVALDRSLHKGRSNDIKNVVTSCKSWIITRAINVCKKKLILAEEFRPAILSLERESTQVSWCRRVCDTWPAHNLQLHVLLSLSLHYITDKNLTV